MSFRTKTDVGPFGAVVISWFDGVVFPEARISIVGTVVQFGIPAFQADWSE